MAVSDAKRRANAKYDAKTYKRVTIRFHAAEWPKIEAYIDESDESFNGFLMKAIKERMDAEDEA